MGLTRVVVRIARGGVIESACLEEEGHLNERAESENRGAGQSSGESDGTSRGV